MFDNVKKLADSFLEMGIPGYDLMVCRAGECILRCQNGCRDVEKTMPMDGTERYYLYSCSKPITVTAAMMLWEEGKLGLDDRLSDYLPEFEHMNVRQGDQLRPAKQPILLWHLFNMCAGFNYDIASPAIRQAQADTQGRCPTREVMKYLATQPLDFEPGTHYQYSLCHDVLAAVVEVVSGEKFEAFVQKRIFDPLGMTQSTFVLPEGEKATLAPQYWMEEKGPRFIGPENTFVLGSEYASGGAGCVSTVEEYMRFLEGLRTGKLVKLSTLERMTADRLTDVSRADYGFTPRYGYGLGLRCTPKGGECTDFGWDGAAGAYLSIHPKEEISLFYAQHMRNPPNAKTRLDLITALLEDLK